MYGRVVGGLAAGAMMIAAPALAHHSFAMFNRDKEVTVEGTVHDFQWTNPHAWIDVDVPDGKGGADKWGVELNSPNNLVRQGWRSDLVKAGDKITVVIHPMRDGSRAGVFVSAIAPDGKALGKAAAK